MARPIKETPILFGEDARRFEERMMSGKTETQEERTRRIQNYTEVLAMLERGKNFKLPTKEISQEDVSRILGK